jgi:hypothetical protein
MCCIVPLIVGCLAPAGSVAWAGPIGGAHQARLESFSPACRRTAENVIDDYGE